MRERRIRFVSPERDDQLACRVAKGSRGGRPPAFDVEVHKQRNVVERGFNRLCECGGVAVRSGPLPRSVLVDWDDSVGVGPVSAAQAIVSWPHPGRCRNDAAYAALAGASPIPASSGRTIRHRLNRGDRALNNALHAIMLTRWHVCPRTQHYIDKRRSRGATDREIRRRLTNMEASSSSATRPPATPNAPPATRQ
ncbi:transposase, partial [Amycolatopsis sp.]|uniref:transposase n=1 Tax=Amycolatopsis sp. TaxID=37632 RepID=UPI002D7E19BB